jgi:hypothetical protein
LKKALVLLNIALLLPPKITGNGTVEQIKTLLLQILVLLLLLDMTDNGLLKLQKTYVALAKDGALAAT